MFVEIILAVFRKILSDDIASRIAADLFYTTLDHVCIVKVEIGNYLYGTIWRYCGLQHCGINNPNLSGGGFVNQYCTLPMPMKIFLCHGSVAAGIWFIISCHNSYATTVFNRMCVK